jgi:hypothetical protein
LAIDKCGHEIVVPHESGPHEIPGESLTDGDQWCEEKNYPQPESKKYDPPEKEGQRAEQQPDKEERVLHVVLCQHICQSDPAQVLASECESKGHCMPNLIKERFRLEFRPGKVPPVKVWECTMPDAIVGGKLNYETLVSWVTHNCPDMLDDCCIPLANINVINCEDGDYYISDVDINIRPVVLSNEALFYLIMSMLIEASPRRRNR